MIEPCTLTLIGALACGSGSLVDRVTSSTAKKPSAIYETVPAEISHKYSVNRTHYDEIPAIQRLYGITSINYLQPQQTYAFELESSPELVKNITLQLASALEAEPVESGYEHPLESLLNQLAKKHPRELANAITNKLTDVQTRSDFKADLLLLVARTRLFDENWRSGIITAALNSKSITERDAALRCAGLLMDHSLLPIIKEHSESVAWLESYRQRIASQLQL